MGDGDEDESENESDGEKDATIRPTKLNKPDDEDANRDLKSDNDQLSSIFDLSEPVPSDSIWCDR